VQDRGAGCTIGCRIDLRWCTPNDALNLLLLLTIIYIYTIRVHYNSKYRYIVLIMRYGKGVCVWYVIALCATLYGNGGKPMVHPAPPHASKLEIEFLKLGLFG